MNYSLVHDTEMSWCLTADEVRWESKISLYTKEATVNLNVENVVVLHKGKVFSKRIKEIWNAVKIPYIVVREEEKKPKCKRDIVLQWLCAYTRFDEENGEIDSYLYRANAHKIEWLEEILQRLDVVANFEKSKFVKIHGHTFDSGTLYKIIDEKSVSWALSFILWLTLLVGKISSWEKWLNHITVQMPLQDNFAVIEDEVSEIIKFLWEKRYFIKAEYIDQWAGQTLQLNIDDEEILALFEAWLLWEECDYQNISLWNKEFLQKELDWTFSSDQVLKLLHK